MTLAFSPARVLAATACAAGLGLAVAPTPAGLPAALLPTAGVMVVCVGLWATAVIPEYLTAVIFCFLAVTVPALSRRWSSPDSPPPPAGSCSAV